MSTSLAPFAFHDNKGQYKICTEGKNLLNSLSWEEISRISETGFASSYFSIGDEIQITIEKESITNPSDKTELPYPTPPTQEATFVILGFNHDELEDGTGKAGITFGMKNLLDYKIWMEYSPRGGGINYGGWATSMMNNYVLNIPSNPMQGAPEITPIFNRLPLELQKVIKTVNKDYNIPTAGSQFSMDKSADKLFLFSLCEITGDRTLTTSETEQQYQLYKQNSSYQENKKLTNGNGALSDWWTRSARTYSQGTAIQPSGSLRYISSTSSEGICFGFCV